MYSKEDTARIIRDIVVKELAFYGRLIDDMDNHRRPMHAVRYRSASVFSMKLILQFKDSPYLPKVCSESPALTELIRTHQLGLEIRQGKHSTYKFKTTV